MPESVSSEKVSIIVPNYNHGQYLPACLDSIFSQTYSNLEVIITDDHSTDNSVEIIGVLQEKYGERLVALLLNENKGVAYARHAAILNSTGSMISTLDADDVYDNPEKIESEVKLILKYRTSENKDIIAFSNFSKANSNNQKVQGHEKNIQEGNLLAGFLKRDCFIPRDFTFSRPLYFEAGGYDFNLVTHEDWDLKIRLAAIAEFHYTGISGILYQNKSTGLSKTPFEFRSKNLRKVFHKNIHLLNNKNEIREVKRRFENFMEMRSCNFYKAILKNNKISKLNPKYFYNKLYQNWKAIRFEISIKR